MGWLITVLCIVAAVAVAFSFLPTMVAIVAVIPLAIVFAIVAGLIQYSLGRP